MKSYSLLHLEDHILRRDLASAASQDRGATASFLAHIAEFDARKLYRAAAYPSMRLYCVRELRMSEDAAYRRIGVARTARRFPVIFPALADGRLNITAVLLLTPYLTQATADDLLAAAANKTKAEIELLLAERFPRRDLPTLVQAIAAPNDSDAQAARPVEAADAQLALERVGGLALQQVTESAVPSAMQLSPGSADSRALQLSPDSPRQPAPRVRIAPLSPGRFAWQVTVDQETQDLLRYAQSLLGHAVPSGDVATVLKQALGTLVQKLEQKKFAKCTRTRPRRSHANGRYVPAEIRRIVWQRDGGQCTFVSEAGKRCEARDRLEFDHVDPVARGGQTTADRMRLRCRAHNQYTAERTFGAGFMDEKRQEARRAASARKQALARKQKQAQSEAAAKARAQSEAAAKARAQAAAIAAADIIPVLRELRFSAEEARRGAALCANMPDAPLEERVRVALRGLAPNCVRQPAPVAS
jgi:5-methylcytosine-specific restriction endonuclease McrA